MMKQLGELQENWTLKIPQWLTYPSQKDLSQVDLI